MTNKDKDINAPSHGRKAATLVLADVCRLTGLSYQQAYLATVQGELDGYQDHVHATRYFTPHAVKEFIENRQRARNITKALTGK